MINKGILIDRQFDAELFADNLRLLREGKGLTQAELGSLCGISENAIRNYELGRCFPKITTLNALADALDVSVGSICIYLFDNDLELQAGLRQICQVYGLRVKTCPIEDKKQNLLFPSSSFMKRFIEEWAHHISIGDFATWKEHFCLPYLSDDFPLRLADHSCNKQCKLKENWIQSCFAKKLKALRNAIPITQRELADVLHISVGALRSYEEGRRLPKKDRQAAIAEALNIDITELMFYDFGDPNRAASALLQIAKRLRLQPVAYGNGFAIEATDERGANAIAAVHKNWEADFAVYSEKGA